jgi:hypothetical protein
VYSVKSQPRFGGIYSFHLQDCIVSQARNKHELLTFDGLRGLISQKTELLIEVVQLVGEILCICIYVNLNYKSIKHLHVLSRKNKMTNCNI